MNTLFRSFFYSIGFMLILVFYSANPETFQLKDFIVMFHAKIFWEMIGWLTGIQVLTQIMLMGPKGSGALIPMNFLMNRKRGISDEVTEA